MKIVQVNWMRMYVNCTGQYQAVRRVNHPLSVVRTDAWRFKRRDLPVAHAYVGRPAPAAGDDLATLDEHVVMMCHGFSPPS